LCGPAATLTVIQMWYLSCGWHMGIVICLWSWRCIWEATNSKV